MSSTYIWSGRGSYVAPVKNERQRNSFNKSQHTYLPTWVENRPCALSSRTFMPKQPASRNFQLRQFDVISLPLNTFIHSCVCTYVCTYTCTNVHILPWLPGPCSPLSQAHVEQVVTVPHCRVRLCCLQDLPQDVTARAELVILDMQSAFEVWDHHSDVVVHQLIGLQVQLALDRGGRGKGGGRGRMQW